MKDLNDLQPEWGGKKLKFSSRWKNVPGLISIFININQLMIYHHETLVDAMSSNEKKINPFSQKEMLWKFVNMINPSLICFPPLFLNFFLNEDE